MSGVLESSLEGLGRCRLLHRKGVELAGAKTHYVLFVIDPATRRLRIGSITLQPDAACMMQMGEIYGYVPGRGL